MRSAIDHRIQSHLSAKYIEEKTALHQQTLEEFDAYFQQKLKKFNIPIEFIGTEFQQKVWNALLEIPFGKTETYLGLSKKLGIELAIRAVATANGANAISIIVPCHRIIGSDGNLVGYAGGISAKKKLLQLENALPQMEMEF